MHGLTRAELLNCVGWKGKSGAARSVTRETPERKKANP